jgi:hypothetical protein
MSRPSTTHGATRSAGSLALPSTEGDVVRLPARPKVVAPIEGRGRTPAMRVRARLRQNLPTLAMFFALVLAVQIVVGTYGSERGQFSDESAHFMNGLLLRDYLTQAAGQDPIAYAQHYYFNYPKIAPGMWPPLFHGVLGLLLLPGWPPQIVALMLIGFATAWTAWRLYRMLTYLTTTPVAVALGALFVLTPAVVNLSSVVMLDVVVAAFALEATFWLALFFESGLTRHAAMFGLMAACDILTKGNGLAILLVAPLMLLFTGRFRLLRRPGLYLAAAIVLLAAGPMSTLSFYFDATIGDFRMVNWNDIVNRAEVYTAYVQTELGLPLLVLAVAGLTSGTVETDGQANRHRAAFIPALAALVVAAALFHLLNPHKVISGRYMTLAIAPVIGLIPNGIHSVLSFIRRPQWVGRTRIALVAALVVVASLNVSGWEIRHPLGLRDAASFIQNRGGLADRRMLVISDEEGEGSFVAEVASRKPNPRATVIRSSKVMADDDWGGNKFQLRFATAGELMKELEDLHVDYLVVDRSLEASKHALWAPTQDLLASEADRLELVHRIDPPASSRPIEIYRLTHQSPGPAKPIEMSISSPFGKLISR